MNLIVHSNNARYLFLTVVLACASLSVLGVPGPGIFGLIALWVFSGESKSVNISYYLIVIFSGLLASNISQLFAVFVVVVLTCVRVFEFEDLNFSSQYIQNAKRMTLTFVGFIAFLCFFSFFDANRFVTFMSRYWDHISHFGILKNLAADRKIYDFFPSDTYSGWLHYPQGWHSSVYGILGSNFFESTTNALRGYMLAFTLTISLFVVLALQNLWIIRNLRLQIAKKNIPLLLYIALSIISLNTFIFFIISGAYVNFAFSISLVILAFRKLQETKRTVLLLILSSLSYTNFVGYLFLLGLYLITKDIRIFGYVQKTTKIVGMSTFLVPIYLISGVFTTKQKSGVFIGVNLSLDSFRYSALALMSILALSLLLRIKNFRQSESFALALSAALFLSLLTISYALLRWEVNYFLQKMLIASLIILIVEANKAFLDHIKKGEIQSQQSVGSAVSESNQRNKKVSKSKVRKRGSRRKERSVSTISFGAITILFFTCVSLLPSQLNPQRDFILGLRDDSPIFSLNLQALAEDKRIDDNTLLVFHSEKNGGYQSYLLNQWVSILGGNFTDVKQNLIEDCLRNVEEISSSKISYISYNADIKMYFVPSQGCDL